MTPVTFLEALAYARKRNIVLSDEFYSLDINTRQMASTVSMLSNVEQIEQVMTKVNKAISSGTTFKEFKDLVLKDGIDLPDYYLKNVFRTNIQSAYGHGRYIQHQRNKKNRPYLQYSAINDSRVRPTHLALDGVIRHIDDPFWLTHTPSLGFMCRCSTISITSKQAEKRGITTDKDLPDVKADKGWSFSPANYGDMQALLDDKILNSPIGNELFDTMRQTIKAEFQASKKLTSLLSPMTDKSRDLFEAIADTAIKLDPTIRPSAIKVLIDYVQGNDSALTNYLKSPQTGLASDVIRNWLIADMAQISAVAINNTATINATVSLSYVSQMKVGQVFTLDSPELLREGSEEIILKVSNANGFGIDLSKLNAGDGVLFPIQSSFKVTSIENIGGKLTYTLEALLN